MHENVANWHINNVILGLKTMCFEHCAPPPPPFIQTAFSDIVQRPLPEACFSLLTRFFVQFDELDPSWIRINWVPLRHSRGIFTRDKNKMAAHIAGYWHNQPCFKCMLYWQPFCFIPKKNSPTVWSRHPTDSSSRGVLFIKYTKKCCKEAETWFT